jgi:hypothetical protein
MESPPVPAIGLHDPFNVVEGDIEPLFRLLYCFFFRMFGCIPILFAHLIPDFPLVLTLLDESQLLLEPSVQLLKSSYLILPGVNLR